VTGIVYEPLVQAVSEVDLRDLELATGLLYCLVTGHMIYEQACRTPWQPLLAHSAASVKVRVLLPLLSACFALLFH